MGSGQFDCAERRASSLPRCWEPLGPCVSGLCQDGSVREPVGAVGRGELIGAAVRENGGLWSRQPTPPPFIPAKAGTQAALGHRAGACVPASHGDRFILSLRTPAAPW
jgi:hypothetical protein